MPYNRQALLDNIKKCDRNIKVFEQAIEDEMATKRKLREMIEENEKREALEKVKKSHVEIIRDNGNS